MRPAGVTVWREIEQVLTREIADGVHPAGAKLPIERDLAAKFGVNRHTVRRALSSLQDKGLISIEPGRGMFAKSTRLSYPVGKRTRFSENVGHLSKYVEGQLLNTWHLAAPEKIAADLDVETAEVHEQTVAVCLLGRLPSTNDILNARAMFNLV